MERTLTRVEVLTLREIDGDLSEEEARELRELVAADLEARRIHLSSLKVDGALRGSRRKPGLAVAVMDRLPTERKARIVRGVMAQIQLPARQVRGHARWRTYAAAASILLAGGAILLGRSLRDPAPAAPTPAAPLASIVETRGSVAVTRGADRRPASLGLALAPGDRIEAAGGASATIAYLGTTRFLVGPEARLTLDLATTADTQKVPYNERVLRLDRGTLVAEVARQPAGDVMVFLTPDARAVVVGTRFTLAVTPAATRLTVSEGRVTFIRLRDGKTVEVGAGQHALSSEGEPTVATSSLKAAPAKDSPETRRLLDVDCEDGQKSALIQEGYPVPGPPRPGNRFALLGELDPHGGTRNSVKISSRAPTLFHYSDTQVISFDYWVDPDAKGLLVQAWTPERDENLTYYVRPVVREAWAHADVRLADMVPQKNPRQPMEEGAPFENIRVVGGRIAGKPLYIDNVRLVQYPPGAVPPASTHGSHSPLP